MIEEVSRWTDVGALAVLTAVLWYLLRDMVTSLRSVQRTLARLAALLIQHDATVRGQNPSTLGSTEELIARILNGGKG